MEPDDIDLLIRSTTSLLSLVSPQAGPSQTYDDDTTSLTPPDQRHLTLLDRLALLFVTQPTSDVAAVAAALTLEGVWLFDAKTDPVPPHHQDVLLFAKNSGTGTGIAQKETYVPFVSSAQKLPGTSWRKHCLKHGPHDAPTYAAQLQFLIAQVLESKREKRGTDAPITEIYHYIYFQCMPKLRQRLFLPIAQGHQTKFYELFADGISPDDLTTRFRPFDKGDHISQRLRGIDETELKNELETESGIAFPTYNWKNPKTSKEVQHILLDGTLSAEFFYCVRTAILILVLSVNNVMALRRTVKQNPAGAIPKLTAALAYVVRSMERLSTLSNNSLTMWRLLNQPAVVDYFEKASDQSVEPIRTDEDLLEGDVDDREDEEMSDIQDEALSNPPVAIRHWMRCVSQWDLALREFRQGSLEKLIFSQSLQIKTIKTPPSPEPRRQASLRATLMALPGFSDLEAEKAEKVLSSLAKEKLNKKRDGCVNKDHLWKILAGEGDGEAWSKTFTGKIHCEAVLASLMELDGEKDFDPDFIRLIHNIKRSSKFIGVSKRCCYACRIFLKYLNPNIKHAACHGKVYPWAIPTWGVPTDVKKKVLEDLQSKLMDFLTKQSARKISSDTASGSDGEDMAGTGSAAHPAEVNHGFARFTKLMRKQSLAGANNHSSGAALDLETFLA